jgi:hypothetical protein
MTPQNMTPRSAGRLATCAALLMLAACGTPDPSTNIPTEKIYAAFTAEVDADGTSKVVADFYEYRTSWIPFYSEDVYLAGGDTLDVRTEQANLLFTGGGSHFEGEMLTGILENTQFRFDLQRHRADFVDAPDSIGTLPAPMDVWLPAEGTEYTIDQDDVTLAWNYGGTLDDMWITVDARCLAPDEPGDDDFRDESFRVDIPGDPGLYTFGLSEETFDSDCTRYAATLTLVRARSGELDIAYKPDESKCGDSSSGDCAEDGFVSVRQVRAVDVILKR